MITVKRMLYWMIAEFMQGLLMPEKLVCIYQSFGGMTGAYTVRRAKAPVRKGGPPLGRGQGNNIGVAIGQCKPTWHGG